MNLVDLEHQRRSYDAEIADLKSELSDVKDQLTELNVNVAGLVEAWNTAKGVTAFVRWLSGVAIAIGVLFAALKGVNIR